MLTHLALACAPAVAVAPAAATLLTNPVELAPEGHLQRRLYRTLLLVEKLPAETPGFPPLVRDIDRRTLDLGYRAQYPHRAREMRDIALIGVAVFGAVAAYYLLMWADASLVYLLVSLALVTGLALWFRQVVANFARNDRLLRELFEHIRPSEALIRPRTELFAPGPALTVATVFERAADIRDRDHDRPQPTVAAVNAVLADVHAHGGWHGELRVLADRLIPGLIPAEYRGHVRAAPARAKSFAAEAYEWLLQHLVGPFFTLRMAYLDERERNRTSRAAQRGDVYRVAWLATYYRNERIRLAEHWSRLPGVHTPPPAVSSADSR